MFLAIVDSGDDIGAIQPDEEALLKDSFLHKFMLVYDRESYSPDFMKDMWGKRIACCTFNKYVKDLWPETEFSQYEVENEYEEKEIIRLAERGILMKLPAASSGVSKYQPHKANLAASCWELTPKEIRRKRNQRFVRTYLRN